MLWHNCPINPIEAVQKCWINFWQNLFGTMFLQSAKLRSDKKKFSDTMVVNGRVLKQVFGFKLHWSFITFSATCGSCQKQKCTPLSYGGLTLWLSFHPYKLMLFSQFWEISLQPVSGTVEVQEVVEVGDEPILPLQCHVFFAQFRRKWRSRLCRRWRHFRERASTQLCA